jgi:hypothetical protein
MKWVIEVEGGAAFCANAASACRINARSQSTDGPIRQAMTRLADALDNARAVVEPQRQPSGQWCQCPDATEGQEPHDCGMPSCAYAGAHVHPHAAT